MRILSTKALRDWAKRHPTASSALVRWEHVARAARWTTIQDIRQQFPHADMVGVKSGRTVIVFNISGNHLRLITAVHFNQGKVFMLRFLTHAQYSKDTWKNDL